MKILCIYSNPPSQTPIRLDKEDKVIANLSREFKEKVFIERLHASEVEDIHSVIIDGKFDIIHFSGHGSQDGIYLEKSGGYESTIELVSADRVINIINLSIVPPQLVVFLSCYSDSHLNILSNSAPFVITSKFEVGDRECIGFVQGFYERLFRGLSIKKRNYNQKKGCVVTGSVTAV